MPIFIFFNFDIFIFPIELINLHELQNIANIFAMQCKTFFAYVNVRGCFKLFLCIYFLN